MTDEPPEQPDAEDEADVTDADDFDMAEVEALLDELRAAWPFAPKKTGD